MKPSFIDFPGSRPAPTIKCPADYLAHTEPHDALFSAIHNDDLPAVSFIVEHANIDFSTLNSRGDNPVHLAIARHCHEGLIDCLIAHASRCGNAVHELNRNGYTPLMLAVEHGNIKLANSLIRMGTTVPASGVNSAGGPGARQREQTLAHAQLLLEAEGNLTIAHSRALSRGMSSFEAIFAYKHAALKSACARGDFAAARASIDTGADPSLVLMRSLSHHDRSTTPQYRATLIRNLIAAGADIATALSYALATGTSLSILETLLLLGVSDDAVAEAAWRPERTGNTWWQLIVIVRNREKSMISAAICGNAYAVRLWKAQGLLDVERVFLELLHTGNLRAIRLLIAEGINTRPALMKLLDLEDVQGVKCFIGAGANIYPVLSEISRQHERGHPIPINKLEVLIQADVDLSQMLLDAVTGVPDLSAARAFIAAGVNSKDALKRVSGHVRAAATKVLDSATKDVRLVAITLRNTRYTDSTLMGDILFAQEMMTLPKMRPYHRILDNEMAYLESEGDPVEAELVGAIKRVDWKSILSLATRDKETASRVLTNLVVANDRASSRLLMHAGVGTSDAIKAGLTKYGPALLARLISFGYADYPILEALVDDGHADFAEEVIQHTAIRLTDMFGRLVENGHTEALRKFIPALSDGIDPLITACERGDITLAKALVAADVDINRALHSAMVSVNTEAVKVLRDLNADLSVALAIALTDGNALVIDRLLILGADPDAALTHVAPERRPQARALLQG